MYPLCGTKFFLTAGVGGEGMTRASSITKREYGGRSDFRAIRFPLPPLPQASGLSSWGSFFPHPLTKSFVLCLWDSYTSMPYFSGKPPHSGRYTGSVPVGSPASAPLLMACIYRLSRLGRGRKMRASKVKHGGQYRAVSTLGFLIAAVAENAGPFAAIWSPFSFSEAAWGGGRVEGAPWCF